MLWRDSHASPQYFCRRSAASTLFSRPYPGAHAPGYISFAAPRLAVTGSHDNFSSGLDPVKSEINRKRIFWAVAIFFGVLIIGMATP